MDAKRVCALGKVEEPGWKNCTGEWQVKLAVMWESRRGGENSKPAQGKRVKLHSSILYFFSFSLLSFLSWHGGKCGVEKVKGFLCYCCVCSLPVPPNWTILFSSPLLPVLPEWRGVTLPPSPSLPSTSPSHNPFLCSFSFFFSFTPFSHGRDWPGHTSTGGQPILS